MRDVEKTIGKLIDKQKVTYIASVDEDGFPNMKAMLAPRKREGISVFYFTTNTSSKRVVMLVGSIEVMEDAPTKEMIWKMGDTIYYKGGVTDPDYCVLKVTVHKGRYYSNFKSEEFEV